MSDYRRWTSEEEQYIRDHWKTQSDAEMATALKLSLIHISAPSLLGIDMDNVPKRKEKDIEGDLFELPEKIEVASDSPEKMCIRDRIRRAGIGCMPSARRRAFS